MKYSFEKNANNTQYFFEKLAKYILECYYDFLDEVKEKILKDIFSTLLNNFGVVSSEYGVIKTYDVKIKFKLNPYRIE